MLPFLIYIFLKKYSNKSWTETGLRISKFIKSRLNVIFVSLLILLLALIPILSKSQRLQLNYKIVQGGDEIGWMQLDKIISGSRLSLTLTSEIKTRIIFQIRVWAKETAAFENGKLIHSTQYRETNGDVNVNKQTRFVADKYEVVENGETQNLNISNISVNLLSLYFLEPAGINMLYSDKFGSLVKITKTDDGGYKVKFPDGNSNVFYYSKGICTNVKIEHTFYTATVILKP